MINIPLDQYKNIWNSFVNLCNENNIWYSLWNYSLISALTNKKMFLNFGYLEVIMDLESFLKLTKICPNNIIDNFNKENFLNLSPFFKIPNSSALIKINIFVFANNLKVEKLYSFKNKLSIKKSFLLSKPKKYLKWYEKFLKFFILKINKIKPIIWNQIFDNIQSEFDYNGVFIIDQISGNLNKYWLPNITYKTNSIAFLEKDSNVFVEYIPFFKKNLLMNKNDEIDFENNKSFLKKIKTDQKNNYFWVSELI